MEVQEAMVEISLGRQGRLRETFPSKGGTVEFSSQGGLGKGRETLGVEL